MYSTGLKKTLSEHLSDRIKILTLHVSARIRKICFLHPTALQNVFFKDSVKARCRTEDDIKNAALIFFYKDNHQINKVMLATENTEKTLFSHL